MDQRMGLIFALLVLLLVAGLGTSGAILYNKGVRDGWMTRRVFLLITGVGAAICGLIAAVFFSIVVKGVTFWQMLVVCIIGTVLAVLGMYIALIIPGFWKLPK